MNAEERDAEARAVFNSDAPQYSLGEWAELLKEGYIGIQSGNMSQRWAYKDGSFIELNEFENTGYHQDMDIRFKRNLASYRKRCVLGKVSIVRVGGE